MRILSLLVSCGWVLCTATPALATTATPPGSIDVTQLAAHLLEELGEARETVDGQGARLEALLTSRLQAASTTESAKLGLTFATTARQLSASLPRLIRSEAHVFEELFKELAELEQLGEALSAEREPYKVAEHLAALQARSTGLSGRLSTHLRRGISRLGERLGAPPALVVSGGVSLGSYQAGFLYYYTLFLHDRAHVLREIPASHRKTLGELGLELPEDPPSGFTVLTGASAGSVNALLSAYAGCREPERVPSKSLFFQVWNTLSMEVLLQPGSVGPDHMFSSEPVERAMARIKELEPSQWRRCHFSLGATTTRLKPREIDLTASGLRSRSKEPISLARFTEKFLLAARGEPGRAPEFCPFPGCEAQPQSTGATFFPRLAQPAGAPIPVDNVFQMIAVSGTFPTAFQPRPLPHRYLDSRSGRWIEDDQTPFADGGIYNNNPLGLAVRLSQWEPSSERGNHRFLYIDPNSVSWKWAPEEQQSWSGPGLLSTYEDLVKGFVGTAVTAQLMDTLEAVPETHEYLDVPVRHSPLAGEYLLAMSAFLDEDFRTFDFHRGMVDAWHFLTRESDTHALFEELAHMSPGQPPVQVYVDSPLFACFLAFEQSSAEEPSAVPACSQLQSEQDKNVQSLMAISRALLKDPTLSQRNKFERFSEALAERGYVFRSGLLAGKPASALRREFRRVAGQAVDSLMSLQPPDQRLPFQVASKLALDDAIAYQPRPLYFAAAFTSAGFELAASPLLTWWDTRELRLRGGVRLAYQQSAPLLNGEVSPELSGEAYAHGLLGLGWPQTNLVRTEVGLGLLSSINYLVEPADWVALRFAVEGAGTVVIAEHVEVGLRVRGYLDGGRESSPVYVPTRRSTTPSQHLDSWGWILGAGLRF